MERTGASVLSEMGSRGKVLSRGVIGSDLYLKKNVPLAAVSSLHWKRARAEKRGGPGEESL